MDLKTKLRFLFGILMFCCMLSAAAAGTEYNRYSNLKAYLTISFNNNAEFPNSLQNKVKQKIDNIFKEEGINLVETEDPSAYVEYKLYIYITIADSLTIEAKGAGTNGLYTAYSLYPKLTEKYKNEKEIYRAVRKYIKENILKRKSGRN